MYEESVVKVREKPFHERSTMGPQTEAEGNVPKDGDPSEEELPPVPAGTFLGLQDDEAGSSDDAEEDGDGVDRGGYQLLNGDIDAEVGKIVSRFTNSTPPVFVRAYTVYSFCSIHS